MKPIEPRACVGTTVVTLLAITAFLCIVASPRADTAVGQQTTEACAGLDPEVALHLGGLQ